jgi:hypothetical protein
MTVSKARRPGVVLSHAWGADHLPHKLVKLVDSELQARGIKTFFDENELLFGDIWREALQRAIVHNEYLTVVFLSPEFAKSTNTRWEHRQALENASSTGKTLIPVLLAEFKERRELVNPDIIVADWSSLFSAFIARRGNGLTKSWFKELHSKCGELAENITLQWQRYESNLHVFRISDPESPALKDSLKIVEKDYPKDYRDESQRIKDYITESTISNINVHFPVEVYLAACFRGEHVGALYATCYRGGTGIKPYCYINFMFVKQDMAVIEVEQENKQTKEVVAEALLSKLSTVINEICGGKETSFLLDLPDPEMSEEDVDPQAVTNCWFAWRTITSSFKTFCLVEPDFSFDFKFMIPDMEWEGDLDAKLIPTESKLLLLQRNLAGINKESFLRLLRFIYWTMYAETYHNPYCIRKWWTHINELYQDVELQIQTALQNTSRIPVKGVV